jgi:HEAT repeat protein
MNRRVLSYQDNGFIPEGSPLEGYEASRAPGAVPFGRVVELANLASERKVENLPKLMAELDDPNEAIRWWSALGCVMLRQDAAPAEAALRKRLEDPSGAVQAAAAEALAQLGHTDLALPVLERWMTNTSGAFYTVHAANVLGSARPVARCYRS